MVILKVCLFIPCFYVFFLIQKFHIAFNELCLSIYIKNKKQKNKKNSRFPNLSQKERKIKKKKKKVVGVGSLSPYVI